MSKFKSMGRMLALVLVCSLSMTSMAYADDVSNLKKEKKEAQEELDEMEEQLAELLVDIAETEEATIAKGEEVLAAQADLAVMEETKAKQYEAMKLRIKYMYENGKDFSVVLGIIGSEDVAASFNKYEYSEKITEYDRAQLQAYVDNITAINNTIAELQVEQAELETLQTQLNEKQGALNELIAEKEKEIKDFDTKIAAAVKKAEEEAKKRAAAQAAAAAAAAQAAGGTTTTAAAATTTSTYTSGSVSGDQIVATAMAYVGTPYVYGGSSPSGFDCSGFTSYVFRQYGITLSRSSSAQLYGGTAVSLSDIQPGDVICYPGHVGLYIGNGQIVHATVPGDCVRVASMYYASYATILGVRRYY
ncbi:MAG: C40 family peptidase [Lachnospiraceae bacterium]|nr:C40 family peptidase [Lachnospiraceae bacterium]